MNPTIHMWAPPMARLIVSGPDAATFLQGQFTNDLRPTKPGRAVYGLWLNQKGRVLADSVVLLGEGNEFEVVSESSTAETIRARLEAYIIADDVTVEDATGGTAGLVVAGPRATEVLAGLGLEAPSPGRFVAANGATVVRTRVAEGPAWRVLYSNTADAGWRERMDGAERAGLSRVATGEEFAARRVVAGLPSVPVELGPGDLPNEGGLEHEAISYTKGCYLGQEVMSRLRNLGQVRRRLFVVQGEVVPGAAGPALPAVLLAGGVQVGQLRSMFRQRSDVRGWVGLAMLQVQTAQPGMELRFGTEADGQAGPAGLRVAGIATGRAWS